MSNAVTNNTRYSQQYNVNVPKNTFSDLNVIFKYILKDIFQMFHSGLRKERKEEEKKTASHHLFLFF